MPNIQITIPGHRFVAQTAYGTGKALSLGYCREAPIGGLMIGHPIHRYADIQFRDGPIEMEAIPSVDDLDEHA
jgi:hypothetical protein